MLVMGEITKNKRKKTGEKKKRKNCTKGDKGLQKSKEKEKRG
jgi:hypothetical protein